VNVFVESKPHHENMMNKNKHIDSEVKEEDSDMGWNFNREEDDEEGD
jgi:hypothetical protein